MVVVSGKAEEVESRTSPDQARNAVVGNRVVVPRCHWILRERCAVLAIGDQKASRNSAERYQPGRVRHPNAEWTRPDSFLVFNKVRDVPEEPGPWRIAGRVIVHGFVCRGRDCVVS